MFYRQTSDVPAARAFLAGRLQRRDSTFLLARRNASACGFVQLYPSLSSVSMKQIAILNDLFVAPDARRFGVGRKLMDRAREAAHAAGAIRIELTTEHNNEAAQRLCRACGYARDDVFHKFILTLKATA